MTKRSLLTIARQELTRAIHSPAGRSERILLGVKDGSRMSVLALCSSRTDHERLELPWTIQVLTGRVRVRYQEVAAMKIVSIGFPGDLITGRANGLLQPEGDCAVLLTLGPPVSLTPGVTIAAS